MIFNYDSATKLYKSTDCGTSGTLQVQLKSQGIITINAGLSGMPTVCVDRYAGDNMLRKIALPDACSVTVVTNVEPKASSFETA